MKIKFKKEIKCIMKIVAFVMLFTALFNAVSYPLAFSEDQNEYQWMTGIYEEREDSLDAVYIGSSNCYAFWSPAIAWERSGIAVLPYVCSSQPIIVAEYFVREARKTQSDALYIINTNTLDVYDDNATSSTVADSDGAGAGYNSVIYHYILDFMPMSLNKLALIDYLCDIGGLSFSERLEYYFPIIRYHDKWESLTEANFDYSLNTVKGSDTRYWFLGTIYDITKDFYLTDEKAPVNDVIAEGVTSLLDYLEEEEVNVLFVTVPRAEKIEGEPERINTVNAMIEERGFTVLDLRDDMDAIGLDMTTDFYNINHTNIHGAIKFTYYLSDYLIENYGFEDKRGDPDYADWDQAALDYADIIKNRRLPFEKFWGQRDYTIPSPWIQSMTPNGDSVELVWTYAAGADGYSIYRRINDVEWEWLGDAVDTTFTDKNASVAGKYAYTVVPYSLKDGEKYYGKFNYWGRDIVKN